MHTASSIHILAPREKVFETVSDLARWPQILPHYRRIEFLGKETDRAIVRMACLRSGIPVSWVAHYRADPQALELRFEHVRGTTKGMEVLWILNPTRDGCRVEIIHDWQFRVRGLGWLAEPVVGRFFISYIARKTLRAFKGYLESPSVPRAEETL